MDGELRFREHVMVVAYSVFIIACEKSCGGMTSKKETRMSTWPYQCDPPVGTAGLRIGHFDLEEFARFTSQRWVKAGALSDQIRA